MSTEYLASLRAKREHAWEAQKALLDTIAAEGRDITAEEREQVERMDADYDRYSAEEKRVTDRVALVSATDGLRAALAPRVETARAERRDPTEGDLVRRLMRHEIRSIIGVPDENSAEYRALATSTDTIDQSFYDVVTVYSRTLNPMLDGSVVTVLNTARGESLYVPRLTVDTAFGGTVTAQAAGIQEADATFGSVVLGAFKYGVTQLYSNELANDASIDLTTLIAESAARDLAIDIGVHLTTGTDTTQPNGIVTAAANGGTASGTASGTSLDTFVSAADLIDLMYTRAAPDRMRGAFMASSTGMAKMRKMRSSTGEFLWDTSLVTGAPPTFNGRPVYENPGMAAVASATKSFLFGDLKRYFVRRLPLRVDISTDYKFNTDQVALRTIERIDGDLIDTAAVAYLVSANT
jgi:HK97 family phage major capsid protein